MERDKGDKRWEFGRGNQTAENEIIWKYKNFKTAKYESGSLGVDKESFM